MVAQRLKIDPEAVDLMLTAIVLAQENRLAHAGHYAFVALGRIIGKNLPDEEGEIDAMNFRRRLERLCREKEFSTELKDQIYSLWSEFKHYLNRKVSYIPSYRGRKIKEFVELINRVFLEHSRTDLKLIVKEMTPADLQRLHISFGDNLLTRKRAELDFKGFDPGDFENIFTLRDNLALAGVKWSEKMKSEGKQLPGPSLSATDYTSAYVTLSFLANPLQRIGEEANFTVMITNRQLQVGLRLGEKSPETRRRYYERLKGGGFDPALTRLADEGVELADTFWYFNLRDRLPLKKMIEDPEVHRAEVGRKAGKALENLESPPPFTGSFLLPLRIWSAKEVCEMEGKVIDRVWSLYPGIYEILEKMV